MDYKEMIKQLKVLGQHSGYYILGVAADAIETLLAERDAAVRDINEMLKSPLDEQCKFCIWEEKCSEEFYSCERNAAWRGIKIE